MKTCSQCKATFEADFRICPFDGAPLTENTGPPADPMLGRVLDERFRIVEKIGQGGMGAVYKAVHIQMDRICAIKLLSPVAGDQESAVTRFQREAKMASRIDSPNAVTIYDFGEAEPGLLYLAMEFIEGESLSQLMARDRSLPLDRIVSITTQIARALSAAHALGIVHRDLKPDNIMLTHKRGEGERVKVLDFGIAKTVTEGNAENLTQTGFVLGTPVYMSPEQVTGDPIDSRSDVYSLAIIVYQMLSGRLPFEGNSARTIMMTRVTNEPRPLRQFAPSVTDAVEQVVMAGLAKEPETRIPSTEAFAAALSTAAMGGTQLIGSRPTNLISDQVYGQTSSPLVETRVAGSQTAPDEKTVPISAQRPTAAENDSTVVIPSDPVRVPQRPTAAESDSTVVIPSEPVGAPQPPPAAPVSSPSLYVTRPVSEPSAPTPHESTPPARRVEPPPVYPPPPPPPRVETNAPAPWPPQQPISAQAPARSDSKSKVALIIVAVLVVFAAVGAAGGYYIYLKSKQTQPSDTSQQTPQQPSVQLTQPQNSNAAPTREDQQVADEHYKAGKQHQQQAYLLANAKSDKEAAAENEQAAAEYRKAVASRPNFPEAHENLGVALYDLGKTTEAIVEYQTAIKQYTKPTSQVFTNLGMANLALQRFREAADAFAQAIELEPTDADLYYFRGFALHYSGDEAGSKAAFTKYLAAAPEGQHAKDVRAMLAGRAAPDPSSPR